MARLEGRSEIGDDLIGVDLQVGQAQPGAAQLPNGLAPLARELLVLGGKRARRASLEEWRAPLHGGFEAISVAGLQAHLGLVQVRQDHRHAPGPVGLKVHDHRTGHRHCAFPIAVVGKRQSHGHLDEHRERIDAGSLGLREVATTGRHGIGHPPQAQQAAHVGAGQQGPHLVLTRTGFLETSPVARKRGAKVASDPVFLPQGVVQHGTPARRAPRPAFDVRKQAS